MATLYICFVMRSSHLKTRPTQKSLIVLIFLIKSLPSSLPPPPPNDDDDDDDASIKKRKEMCNRRSLLFMMMTLWCDF